MLILTNTITTEYDTDLYKTILEWAIVGENELSIVLCFLDLAEGILELVQSINYKRSYPLFEEALRKSKHIYKDKKLLLPQDVKAQNKYPYASMLDNYALYDQIYNKYAIRV